MVSPWHPHALDIARFTEQSASLEGVTPLAELPRLGSVCDLSQAEAGACQVAWTLRGEIRSGAHGQEPWLCLVASVVLPVTCQRCLHRLSQPVTVDRWFRLVADEATALAQDDDSEEDLLALSASFDVVGLLEDELLLALPLILQHPDCQPPASQALVDDLPHPFAALAALKRPQGG